MSKINNNYIEIIRHGNIINEVSANYNWIVETIKTALPEYSEINVDIYCHFDSTDHSELSLEEFLQISDGKTIDFLAFDITFKNFGNDSFLGVSVFDFVKLDNCVSIVSQDKAFLEIVTNALEASRSKYACLTGRVLRASMRDKNGLLPSEFRKKTNKKAKLKKAFSLFILILFGGIFLLLNFL